MGNIREELKRASRGNISSEVNIDEAVNIFKKQMLAKLSFLSESLDKRSPGYSRVSKQIMEIAAEIKES